MLPDFSFDITNKVLGVRNQVNYLESSRVALGFSNSLSKIYESANIGAMHTLKLFNDAENVRKLSGISSLEGITKMFDTYTAFMPKLSENILINKSLPSIANIYQSVNVDGMYKLTESILKMYEPLKFDTYGFEETFSELHQRLNEMVQAIPDEEYDVLLKDTEYTKADVLGELEVFIQTDIGLQNEYSLIWQDDSLSLKQKKDKILEVFYTNHPAIYTIVFIGSMLCAFYGFKEMGENFLLPMFENAIVYLEGNQDTYFVNVEDGARLYQYADTKSKVIMYVNFTEQVEVIDEIKFWSQVRYLDEEDNEVIGWIAKRNLISYKDWKYHSDELYSGVK